MFVSVGQAALIIGVSISTLRRWEREERIRPNFRTLGGHRRYSLAEIKQTLHSQNSNQVRKTIAYARVSSHDQKADLGRQIKRLSLHCSENQYSFEVISDLGSGLNFEKKGLNKLVREICLGQVERLVLTHKDRLLRFGTPLLLKICGFFGTRIEILDDAKNQSFEEELVGNVIELMTVFSARIYGKRSHKNSRKLAA